MRARWQVRQQAEVFNATRGHPRVLTLRMEELESGFDPAVTRLLRFLLSGSEMPRNVSGARAAQATPLPSTSPLPLRLTARCPSPPAAYHPTPRWLPLQASEAMVPRLLAATTQFDVTRHRGELDDGHLSPRQHTAYMYAYLAQAAHHLMYANAYLAQRKALPRPRPSPQPLILALTLGLALALSRQRKAQLRAILLNDTGLAAQLTSWRRAAGYDASFAAHCARYGFKYHEESAAILGSTGPGMGGPMRLRV